MRITKFEVPDSAGFGIETFTSQHLAVCTQTALLKKDRAGHAEAIIEDPTALAVEIRIFLELFAGTGNRIARGVAFKVNIPL